ncbi:MAG: hypothetical protein Q9160_003737 [Pyrenula sp. 1 TL-2023]
MSASTTTKDMVDHATEGSFAFDSRGFNVGLIPRASASKLRQVLTSHVLLEDEARRASRGIVIINTKMWLRAQFTHYGLKANHRTTLEQLKAGMELRSRTERAEGAAQWQKHGQTFSQLATPDEEANYNIELFLRKYFVDGDGCPEMTRTRDVLYLPSLANQARFCQAAEKVPGLHTQHIRFDSNQVVIGWDKDDVSRKAAEIEGDRRKERATQKIRDWERKLQEHYMFVEEAKKSDKIELPACTATGSYMIRSTKFEERFDEVDIMTLDIHNLQPGAFKASFDFGVLEGTMLLAAHEDLLYEVMAKLERDEESSDDGDDSDEDNGDGDESEDEDGSTNPILDGMKKRKASTQSSLIQERAIKKAKERPERTLRFHLQWRGVETGEGDIQHDPSNGHSGHLEFTDDTFTRFEGEASFAFVGSWIKFSGYKVGNIPVTEPEEWCMYSEMEHERARGGRRY